MKFFWAATALLLLMSIGLFVVLERTSDAPVAYLATLSFNMTAFGLFLSSMAFLYSKNRNSGAVLVDVGPNPQRLFFLFVAVWFGVSYAHDVSRLSTVAAGFSPKLLLAVSVFYLTFGRLQFRQNGLWSYGLFVPWRNVVSYRWMDATMVKAEIKGFPYLSSNISLRVHSSQKQTVSDLLAQRLPDIRRV